MVRLQVRRRRSGLVLRTQSGRQRVFRGTRVLIDAMDLISIQIARMAAPAGAASP
jgi:hypothetical protein